MATQQSSFLSRTGRRLSALSGIPYFIGSIFSFVIGLFPTLSSIRVLTTPLIPRTLHLAGGLLWSTGIIMDRSQGISDSDALTRQIREYDSAYYVAGRTALTLAGLLSIACAGIGIALIAFALINPLSAPVMAALFITVCITDILSRIAFACSNSIYLRFSYLSNQPGHAGVGWKTIASWSAVLSGLAFIAASLFTLPIMITIASSVAIAAASVALISKVVSFLSNTCSDSHIDNSEHSNVPHIAPNNPIAQHMHDSRNANHVDHDVRLTRQYNSQTRLASQEWSFLSRLSCCGANHYDATVESLNLSSARP